MGISIDRESFEPAEYERFSERLGENLAQLRDTLRRPQFGHGPVTLGAEVELVIVGEDARALPLNRTLLARSLDPHLQLELDRFNLEYNLSPVPAAGCPFGAMQAELQAALTSLDAIAAEHRGRVMTIGILPTLGPTDLTPDAITDLPRYRALSAGIRRIRKAPFAVHIEGQDSLDVYVDDVTLEGATTSNQLHVRVPPEEFASFYNALQLVTAPALAVSTNSPFFMGRRLWEETRIAVFRQAVDSRTPDEASPRQPPRVSFGSGWVREGVYELFAEAVAVFPPLLPICDTRQASPEQAPLLGELRLHCGTVWRWNRAVYDPDAGGHLRVEARGLPSGPTPVDMAASAAFMIGAARGLMPDVHDAVVRMPFGYAAWNFYRAARTGLDAKLVWPDGHQLTRPTALQLCEQLLPVAERGLSELGVEAGERSAMLGIIQGRLDSGLTGARWQRARHEKLLKQRSEAPFRDLVRDYIERSDSGAPVHTWEP